MNGIQQWGGYGGQQLAPQGLLGGLLGASRGFGSGFGNSAWTNQSGQNAGGLGGANLQFQQDPLAQAYGWISRRYNFLPSSKPCVTAPTLKSSIASVLSMP